MAKLSNILKTGKDLNTGTQGIQGRGNIQGTQGIQGIQSVQGTEGVKGANRFGINYILIDH